MNSYLKRFAGTVIAFIVFIILLASVLLFDKEKHADKNLEKVFPGIKAEEIISIRLKSGGSEFVLEKDNDDWVILGGSKKLKADNGAVGDLIKDVKEMEVEKLVSRDSRKLNDYGIVKSETEFSIKTKTAEYPLIIGDKSPVGSGVYIYDLGEGRVLIVKDQYLGGFMNRGPGDFRDRKLFNFEKEGVNRISVKVGGFSADLTRGGGKWVEVIKEDRRTADQKKVRELIDSFSEMKAEGFEDDEPQDLNKYGLLEPTAGIEFYLDGKGAGVLFGKRKDEESYYIKLNNEAPVYSVSKNYFKILPKSSEELLSR